MARVVGWAAMLGLAACSWDRPGYDPGSTSSGGGGRCDDACCSDWYDSAAVCTDCDCVWDSGRPDPDDTALAIVAWYARFDVPDGTFDNGGFGVTYLGIDSRSLLCTDVVNYAIAGDAPAGCPDCDWSFALDATTSTATGDYCGDFGRTNDDLVTGSGGLPTWFTDLGWGFATEYLYTLEGTELVIPNTVFMYYTPDPAVGWYPMFHNYSYEQVAGDAASFEAVRAITNSGTGEPYYYYYTP